MRVAVAMSGGVDSSVAAALMVQRGHDVTGITLKLRTGPKGDAPTQGCCTAADAIDARRVADTLGIPYYVFDVTEPFEEGVVRPFIDAYASGRTPNPCVECNRTVKFSLLLDRARSLGMDALVTGHHVRLRGQDAHGFRLLRAVDPAKDQSYVLHMLGQDVLSHCLFPVGEMTKAEVRRVAADLGLRTADKPESQDVCFLGRDGLRGFLAPFVMPGSIVDRSGREVGRHHGSVFTIGQRRGLGVATGRRVFVTALERDGTVVVGDEDALMSTRLELESVSWVRGSAPEDEVDVCVRYRGALVPARLDGTTVLLDRPVRAAAPGQSAVFYRGDEMLGGGIITRATP